jgi:hypothetical protein
MRHLVLLLGAVLACSAVAQDQDRLKMLRTLPPQIDPQAEALLIKMRTMYSSIKTARLTTTYEEVRPGARVLLTSKCAFKAPFSIRMVSEGLPKLAKSGYLLVTNGKRVHVAGLPSKAYTRNFDGRELRRNLPHINLEVMCLWDWDRQLSRKRRSGNMFGSTFKVTTEMWRGRPFTILEETNKGQEVRVRYYLDPKTTMIWRTEVFRLEGAQPHVIATIDTMELNVALDPNSFVVPEVPETRKKVKTFQPLRK